MQERGSQDRPGRRPVRILRLRMPLPRRAKGMGRGAATPPPRQGADPGPVIWLPCLRPVSPVLGWIHRGTAKSRDLQGRRLVQILMLNMPPSIAGSGHGRAIDSAPSFATGRRRRGCLPNRSKWSYKNL